MAQLRQLRRGFTLIEVLIALAALAIMAGLSWRSVDGLLKTQAQTRAASDSLLTLQATLSQWELDLNSVVESGVVTAIDFDGVRLRLTRKDALDSGGGVRVVSWSRERGEADDGRIALVRWQSPLARTRGELLASWERAAVATPSARPDAVRLVNASAWQLFFYRQNAWVNPLSAAEQANADELTRQTLAAADALRRAAAGGAGSPASGLTPPLAAPVKASSIGLVPDGVRLIFTPDTSGSGDTIIGGPITKDWIRPQFVPSQG